MPANCIKITLKDGCIRISPSEYQVRFRRDKKEAMQAVIFAVDEFVYMTDTKEYYRGDGVTPGGVFFAKE